MSKVTLGILFTAIVLVIAATIIGVPGFSGGAGVLIVAGLVYAFHVAKREVLLLTYSMEVRGDERERKSVPKPPVPNEMRRLGKRAI